MPPVLIYSSDSGDLQSSWLSEFDVTNKNQRVYFGASETGWINDKLGLAWLNRFDQETRSNNQNSYQKRLLLIDGYGSHITKAFIDRVLEANIIVVVLPSYFTYCLQSLDISVFRVLAQVYSDELD